MAFWILSPRVEPALVVFGGDGDGHAVVQWLHEFVGRDGEDRAALDRRVTFRPAFQDGGEGERLTDGQTAGIGAGPLAAQLGATPPMLALQRSGGRAGRQPLKGQGQAGGAGE